MFPFVKLSALMLESFKSLMSSGIFWLIVLFIGFQNRRMARMSQQLFDMSEEPLWPSFFTAAFFGIIGGIIGSFLLVLVGISVLEIGIKYLWITAIFLMFIRQRFLCFAYAGGLLSLSRIFLGFPQVSIPQVMGLVAILHMVEALLIRFSAHLQPLPIYLRTRAGDVVGGFNLQKFWPLPLVALLAWSLPSQDVITNAVQMPDWWPLIKAEFLQGSGEPFYMMMPVIAALGYGDLALSCMPREKTRRSSRELALYSVILLIFAITASYVPKFALIPALFGPLGHEYLIYVGQKREMKSPPLFVQPQEGVKILYVLHKSPLKKAGVSIGDIVLEVNDCPVNDTYQIQSLLLDEEKEVKLTIVKKKTEQIEELVVKRKPGNPLGFIAVPEEHDYRYLEVKGGVSVMEKWWKKLRTKLKP